jgi:hypothetical protein
MSERVARLKSKMENEERRRKKKHSDNRMER